MIQPIEPAPVCTCGGHPYAEPDWFDHPDTCPWQVWHAALSEATTERKLILAESVEVSAEAVETAAIAWCKCHPADDDGAHCVNRARMHAALTAALPMMLAAMTAECDAALATVKEYDRQISWNVTCSNCANLLDFSIKETERAEKAEAEVARLTGIDQQK